MQILILKSMHVTPPVDHLLPFPQLFCTAPGCTAVFTNSSNLKMHLKKHHKITPSDTDRNTTIKLFHCPVSACIYNVSRGKGKHFKCLKYLRQHFQKVHTTKNYACSQCGKFFRTPGLLNSHVLHVCGKQLKCFQCEMRFDNREALLMHGKRKRHEIHSSDTSSNKVAIPALPRKRVQTSSEQHTHSDEKRLKEAVKKTEDSYTRFEHTSASFENNTSEAHYNSNNAAIDFASLFCDIETQTELPCTAGTSSNVPLPPLLEKNLKEAVTQTDDTYACFEHTSSSFENNTSEAHYNSNNAAIDFASLFCDIETQTELPCTSGTSSNVPLPPLLEKSLKEAVTQTDDTYACFEHTSSSFENNTSEAHYNSNNAAIDFASLLCDIETQTELPCTSGTSGDVPLLDQVFLNSSHMYTQTCDDYLRELGLADIQTQTNWSYLENELPSGAMTGVHPHGHDELFVSTETQTSFAQCLLEGSSESNFSGLCITQHTQTCESLLEGLFGAQDSDFIGSFQSTYTQT